MITTTAGKFEADSPFLRRPIVRGMGALEVTQSRGERTVVVQPFSGARVTVKPIFSQRPVT